MTSIKLWISAARPKTLFIGASPILIGNVMAYHALTFDFTIFLWSLLGAICIQIGTNYSNDYFDFLKGADTEKRKGSKKPLQQGLISLSEMKKAFIFFFILSGICTFILMRRGGLPLFFVGAICILFSLLYTAPPFPLAYLGLGDLFVLIFYGPVATLCSYYLQTLSLSNEVFLASLAPGLLGLGPLIMNNMRDYHEDTLVHKKTLIVRYGLLFGKIYYLIICCLCFLVSLTLYYIYGKSIIALLPLLLFIPCNKALFSAKTPEQMHAVFIKTAKIIPFYTFTFCLSYLL